MSRSKEYQRLLNSPTWKHLRAEKLAMNPLCEDCMAQGYVTPAVDCHHIRPVEDCHTLEEMKSRCYDIHNLRALCIPCHQRTHREMRSKTREGHQQRAKDDLQRWIETHRRKS